MKKVSSAIFVAFIALTITFGLLGGSFGRKFWLDFLPGLMANLVVLALGVIVIDNIFKKEHLSKLTQTNVSQSRMVQFLNNRLAYLLLENLALATKDDFQQDPGLTFEFARDRLRDTNLATVFYNKLMEAEDRQAFAEAFATILHRETQGISKSLDGIYPRPDPTTKEIAEQMIVASGSLSAFKDYLGVFPAVNAGLAAGDQFKPDQIDLLTEIAYSTVGPKLQHLRHGIEELSDRAKANRLFIQLD